VEILITNKENGKFPAGFASVRSLPWATEELVRRGDCGMKEKRRR